MLHKYYAYVPVILHVHDIAYICDVILKPRKKQVNTAQDLKVLKGHFQ